MSGPGVVEPAVDLRKLPPGQNAVPFHVSPERWAFDIYDTATQAMSSNYVQASDGRGEYRSIPFRYVWPAELDLMAQLAGMRLRERWAGWTRELFTSDSGQHVSIWENPRANRQAAIPAARPASHARLSAFAHYRVSSLTRECAERYRRKPPGPAKPE